MRHSSSRRRRSRRHRNSFSSRMQPGSYDRALRCEPLEDRRMLALLTVNSDQDNTTSDTELTLPKAILLVNHAGDANAALGRALTTEEGAQIVDSTEAFGTNDTITFDAVVFATPQTIALGSQLPTITKEMTITGPGADLLTIDAGDGPDNTPANGDGFRIFDIDDRVPGPTIDVELIGHTLTGGGGIVARGAVTLINSTIGGNNTTGYYGGGGIFADGAVTLTNSTVTDNHAMDTTQQTGGGIYCQNFPIDISGSIVAGNTADGGPDLNPGTGTLTVNYSLIGDNAGTSLVEAQTPDANGNLIGGPTGDPIDPMLGPLQNNGSPTETHALLAGSPAIDAGDPNAEAGAGNVPLYDQRGEPFTRVYGDGIDIGSVEQQPVHADFDEDGDVDGGDFLGWQRGYGLQEPNAYKRDGDADDDRDVDGDDLTVWNGQFGIGTAPLVAAASMASEPAMATQATGLSAEPLSAELVDAAIAMDRALHPKSDSAPAAPPGEDRFDWLPHRARWIQSIPWQERSEIANNFLRSRGEKGDDGGFYRDADAALAEELLDALFAEDGLKEGIGSRRQL